MMPTAIIKGYMVSSHHPVRSYRCNVSTRYMAGSSTGTSFLRYMYRMGLFLISIVLQQQSRSWILVVHAAWSFENISGRNVKGTFERSMMSPCCHHPAIDIDQVRSIAVSSQHPNSNGISTTNDPVRRKIIRHTILSCFIPSYVVLGQDQISMAADRRQLELCVVAVLRVMYWAQYECQQIDAVLDDNNVERQRAIYLETRLGAKAVLTGRITGSGATNRVYILTTLQLPGCLQDLEWYLNANSRNRNSMGDVCTSFREALASIVEFDGLDALTDPSPRTALTMSQFNIEKLKLIRRTLNEKIIPDGQKLAEAFGPEAYQRSNGYVQQYYLAEIPVPPTIESIIEE